MKGLIKYNFYAVKSSFFASVIFLSSLGILGILISFFTDISNSNLFSVILIAQFSGLFSLTLSVQPETDAFYKLETTFPIKRKDVITSQYILSIFFIMVGFIMASLTHIIRTA